MRTHIYSKSLCGIFCLFYGNFAVAQSAEALDPAKTPEPGHEMESSKQAEPSLQTEPSQPPEPSKIPEPKKPESKKKSESAKTGNPKKATDKNKDKNRDKESAKGQTPSFLFPDWPTQPFGLGLRPVLGYAFSKENGRGLGQIEGGLEASAQGFPPTKNPGMTLDGVVGYALGYAYLSNKNSITDSVSDGKYQRYWFSVAAPIYYRFLRFIPSFGLGHLDGKVLYTTDSYTLSLDSAVLILSFLSAHYTITYQNITSKISPEKYETAVVDNWIHARAFTSILNAFADFGPGASTTTYKKVAQSPSVKLGNISNTYLKLLTGFSIIPGFLSFSGNGKYVFSNENLMKNLFFPTQRNPGDDLNAATNNYEQPADSLFASAFFGTPPILGGLSLGWRYNYTVYNMSEKNGLKKQVSKSSGWGVNYELKF